LLDRGYGRPKGEADENGGEIIVTIRKIVQGVSEPHEAKIIEHKPIYDSDGELD
jgi:hypothetical protein